ncbi:MAG TPA: flagellar basal-body rod protein FlgG [Bacteroidetes bacterium]|nr:flagellar basal-body rod protein FlgG [Bacteroidota bacterium]HEX04780.1 flagellar basal-body rod protein FlgG [Bacteroidota bacterium]
MMRALRTAASGMYAQQLQIDSISNNLANVNTTGYKKSKVEFQDLIYQTIQATHSVRGLGTTVPAELQIGHGVKPVAIEKNFSQGSPSQTGNMLDMSIEGEGFFQIMRPDASIAYTRNGNFSVSPDGRIVNSDGYLLEPEIIIPQDALEITIDREGYVFAKMWGDTESTEVGQIELARFTNPTGLRAMGQTLFKETEASGIRILANPGQEGFGEVHQGYLEASNVQVVEEMVDMIIAQRAYELSSKAIKTADSMMQEANNLKRG